MPGHHRVRFAGIPTTPSSNASLASSPGPPTPPSLLYAPLQANCYNTPSPYYYPVPLPAAPVQIHPVFACTLGTGGPLSWDLTQDVNTVLVRTPTGLRTVSDHLAMEPATTPRVASIIIVSEHLPWQITVNPNPDAAWAAPYVTVGDVLYALYRALRMGVTAAELHLCDLNHRERVHATYHARYSQVARADERATEKNKGIKRVDFLCGARKFVGLSLVPDGNPAKGLAPGLVWRLHVVRP
ncbi:uncharacterized protein TRAVEDRAFT_35348 [Trametes versicolor FP-101664 SS1]|uniref:uncharacterized protein n=1 Tax=Trametes versicolor (strain FP-101664) TaxID=717944 RepID=UPI0004622E0D|nr:uncharacterized protein TRAVEDRAFT_35348 [Trametes versicolor FP-101664 SS1]EIW61920.1 hypothetical protein TRAVEDRAFT_35348 [Trametes versicolor FP-101664 SS1]